MCREFISVAQESTRTCEFHAETLAHAPLPAAVLVGAAVLDDLIVLDVRMALVLDGATVLVDFAVLELAGVVLLELGAGAAPCPMLFWMLTN